MMSGRIGASALVVFFAAGWLTGCGSSSSSSPPPPPPPVVAIAVKSGSPQSSANGMQFGAPLAVTVTQNGIGVVGQKVTFTAPSSGASGTFANGMVTDTEVTNTNGIATSSTFTANTTAGSYAVSATATGATTPASFSLTNIATTAYVFSVTGQETSTSSLYSLAGTVLIDANGNVIVGEQDYNDGLQANVSPQPSGDTITGGSLMFPTGAPAGQGVLTLNTNNSNLGANGVEMLGVQFVNSNHALVMQFDGFATSSGSMDVQTLPNAPSGSFAFVVSGFESAAVVPVNYGGVLTISGTSVTGTFDVNDPLNSGIKTGKTLTATLTPPDTFGRGTIKGIVPVPTTGVTLNYYVVGPEVLRIVDVSLASAGSGSAFGQGSGTFSNASLGTSVVSVFSTPFTSHFGALGQFTTSNTSTDPANFDGVADDAETDNGVMLRARHIIGTYSIARNGYGSLNITNANLGNFNTLGVYMTDPVLNLTDPNSTSGGGGALVMDLSASAVLPGGAGVIAPQTDTAQASFAGNYATGWQNFSEGVGNLELDMIAQATMTSGGALSLTGLVSDPFLTLGTPDATSSGNMFTGTPSPDASHAGRYLATMHTMIDGLPGPAYEMIVYQASGTQLFWLESDPNLSSLSFGPLEQQGSLTGVPALKRGGKMPANRHGQARAGNTRK